MSESSSQESYEEYELDSITKRASINVFGFKNKIKMGMEPIESRKRCSSASINLPKNFVPKLRPIKSKLCPSPIILNEKPPPKKSLEIQNQNTSISTSSFDSRNDFKKIRLTVKKSFKLINEKVYAISDNENNNKKGKNNNSESDSSQSEEIEKNNIKLRHKNNTNNMKRMRIKMAKIRKTSLNENSIDDTNIGKGLKTKSFNIFKKIQSNFVNKFRNNKHMSMYPLDSIKYRNKSHNSRTGYIPTILGFLERNKSSFCLSSMGK